MSSPIDSATDPKELRCRTNVEDYLKHAVIIVVQDPHMFVEHVGAILHDVGHESVNVPS